jgi:hypothetical protein
MVKSWVFELAKMTYWVYGAHYGEHTHLDDREDRVLDGLLPRIDISRCQDYFRIWIVLQELVDKVDARDVFDGLAHDKVFISGKISQSPSSEYQPYNSGESYPTPHP